MCGEAGMGRAFGLAIFGLFGDQDGSVGNRFATPQKKNLIRRGEISRKVRAHQMMGLPQACMHTIWRKRAKIKNIRLHNSLGGHGS